ncbi:dehydrogenase [Solibacillus sp. FSL W7-1464]|uniref:dehydrogenase n=1 Tax=Solibacillus sp. FSL W7-1464 TaxID=2921706 RepID=UPI0030F78FD9
MKKWLSYALVVGMVLLLTACNTKEDENESSSEPTEPVQEKNDENKVDYELLLHLDTIPPEVGTSISIVQDEKLYTTWADIFGFESVPSVDFETEEVLFVTGYSDGCGREIEKIEKDGDTLVITLNYPEDLRSEEDIACTEIALDNTYVVKMKKTNTTKGKLIDINRTIYEEDKTVQEKLQ